MPPLDTIREAVLREWLNAHRIEAEQKLYRALLERYQIVVETAPKNTQNRKPRDEMSRLLLGVLSALLGHSVRADEFGRAI